MKYEVQFTNQFKKDLKLAKKQHKNLDKLFEIINILADGGTLDIKMPRENLWVFLCPIFVILYLICYDSLILFEFHSSI